MLRNSLVASLLILLLTGCQAGQPNKSARVDAPDVGTSSDLPWAYFPIPQFSF